MTSLYTRFNLFCLVLSFFFVLGTFGVWFIALADFEFTGGVGGDEEDGTDALAEHDNLAPVSYVSGSSTDETPDMAVAPEEKNPAQAGLEDGGSNLPDHIILAVPFTSQAPEKNWDQPWQDACEEAAILMLDAYYKKYGLSPLFARDELQRLVNTEEENGWGGSIEMSKVASLAEDLSGKKAKIIENPSIDDVKNQLALGNPVLAVADGKILPNPHFQGGGPEYHALVIRGYTTSTFITNDPGTQFGEKFEYTYDDLMNSLRDWNGGDVKNGRRVVMVLE